MPRAVWNGTVIADCDGTVILEGHHCDPPESIPWEHLRGGAPAAATWHGRTLRGGRS